MEVRKLTPRLTPRQISRQRGLNRVDLTVSKKLGAGKFEVFHAQARILYQPKEYALKAFRKDQASTEAYIRENEILSKLSHPHVIQYVSISNFKSHMMDCNFILTEYAPHGTFFSLTTNKGLTNEKVMRTYFQQLVEGLEYIHSQGVAHLDLKLENLLLGEDFNLKIIDFDQSQKVEKNSKLDFFGTPCYRAPEVWTNSCSNLFAADIYSLGIILFILKANGFPFVEHQDGAQKTLIHFDLFNHENDQFWLNKVANQRNQDMFDDEFKSLINGMLKENPNERLTIQDIKQSKWYNGPTLTRAELKVDMEKTMEKINFRKYLKKSKSF